MERKLQTIRRMTAGASLTACQNAARDIAFQREQALGRVQQIQNFGAHVVHRREATPGRFTLTTFLCTLQRGTSKTSPALRLHASYRHAATLDTKSLAKSYSDGSHPRLSSSHFLSATASICSKLRLITTGDAAADINLTPNAITRSALENSGCRQPR